ncbi:MAG: GDSL-type esterase/lipase family protein [Candidatus Bathyarchaeota archaeon]|nr:GDSL-type esterase/lipase family protein [Candidatus Termiticorpusculum sp.]
MNKKTLGILLTVCVILVFASSGIVYLIGQNSSKPIRVACVGDSLTQSTEYPYNLMNKLGDNYVLRNFGAGSTTVNLASETPYMESTLFQDALDFKPNIVIIMLGTNDAQPSLFPYNGTFVGDYITLIQAFQKLSSNPEIWLVLPPPLFDNHTGHISPEYFDQTILPGIQQVANETNLPVIDVYSLLVDYPEYFPDGIHPKKTTGNGGNEPVAQIMATAIHKAIAPPQP